MEHALLRILFIRVLPLLAFGVLSIIFADSISLFKDVRFSSKTIRLFGAFLLILSIVMVLWGTLGASFLTMF